MRKCRKCDRPAIIYLPAHKLGLCRPCYIPWFQERVRSTIDKFKMFGRRERILVAVSGGKDSLALWHALTVLGYQADGFYIDLGIGHEGYSTKSRAACEKMAALLDRPLRVVVVAEEAGATIPEIRQLTRRVVCSACGLTKRYLMNKFAALGEYDVLATGHNLDDEVAALFGNVLYWQSDYLARQGPVLAERDGLKRKVKPLVLITEKETTVYALANNLPYMPEECPFAAGASTIFYKEILNRIEHESPGTKQAFYSGYLKFKDLFQRAEVELKPCSLCGQPTTGEICAFCRMTAAVAAQRNRERP